jgi:type I restriction enzyme S subunit
MKVNFPIKKVEEIAEDDESAISIGPFGSDMTSDAYVDDGIPVIRGSNINSGRSFEGDFVYITEDKADELSSANVYPGDLIFPHRGAIGEVGLVPEEEQQSRWMLSSSLMKLTCDEGEMLPKFVYYFFRSNLGQHELLKNSSNVGTPGISSPLTSLSNAKVPYPELRTQKKIVQVLSAFDDLIENNKRRIEILEEMAEAIYREWFVNFNFPGSEDVEMKDSDVGFIPENWSIETFSEIAHFQNGYSFSGEHWQEDGKPIVKISELKNGITDQTDFYHGDDIDEKYYIDDGDLIFSWSASLYIDIWKKGPALLNQHLYKVMPKDDIELNFVHRSLVKKLEEFRSRMRGTTMQHIRKSDLEEVKVAVPPSEIREQFDQKIDPINQELLDLHKQNQTLRQTRDLLLPRLVSGEVEIRT